MAASNASNVTDASVAIIVMNGMNSGKGVVKSAVQAFSFTFDNSDEGIKDWHYQDTNVWIALQNFDYSLKVVATMIRNGIEEHQIQLSAANHSVEWIVNFGDVLKIEPQKKEISEIAYGVARQFQRTYISGNCEPRTLTLLAAAVTAVMNGETKYYSPCVNIVQSSGAGKTRSVFQLAKCGLNNGQPVPLFYVCHREPGDTGYPASTDAIFDFLHCPTPMPSADVELVLLCRYYAFLLFVYELATSFDPRSEHSRHWREGYWTGMWDISKIQAYEETLLQLMKVTTQNLREDTAFGWLSSKAATRTPSAGGRRYNGPFFIVIDECRSFRAVPPGLNTQSDPLLLMTRAARCLWRLPGTGMGAMITIDTLPHAVHPTVDVVAPSGRTLPVRSELMFFTDILNHDLQYSQATTVGVAVSDEHALTTGRPLWSAALETADDTAFVLDMIEAKLCCAVNLTPAGMSPAQAAAILCCSRIGLDPNPYPNLSRDLVGSHLAHLDHFDHKTGMVLTSYRSDAAIARASRRIWRDEALLVAAINHIFQFMRTCEMQRGERGEITAQILMLLAADTLSENGAIYTVREFLQELLFERSETLKAVKETNSIKSFETLDALLRSFTGKGGAAHEHVLDGVMNLTQFVKISYQPSVGDLMSFFSRGCGVIWKDCFEEIDLLVPVVLREPYSLDPKGDPRPTAWGPRAGTAGGKSGEKAVGQQKASAEKEETVDSLSAVITGLGVKEGGSPRQPPNEPDDASANEQALRAALPIAPNVMTFLAASVKSYSTDQLCKNSCDAKVAMVKGLGSTTPYVAVGMYFTRKPDAVVYPLARTSSRLKAEPQCLGVAVNNAHLLRTAAIASALGDLLAKTRDAVAYLPDGVDVSAKLSAGGLHYGTVQI